MKIYYGEPERDWERMWAPYDQKTYFAVLAEIRPDDIVLDIGAGDLRLTREIAKLARRVYAYELHVAIVKDALFENPLPENLSCVICDALWMPFPSGVSAAVLLMRHCTHYRNYVEKLKSAGASRLITNVRWGFGVEVIHLDEVGIDFDQLELGWYACSCGATGFKPGPAERVDQAVLDVVHEVINCPECREPF